MEKIEYDNEIQKIVKKDCERIIKEIIELYEKKIEVNKSFINLVEERITPKYMPLLADYYNIIIKLIPDNLYICPNNKWALVTEEEFNKIVWEEKIKQIEPTKNLDKIVEDIVDDLLKKENPDYFAMINHHLKKQIAGNCPKEQSKYILDSIYYNLKKRGYTINSLESFNVEKN